MGDEWDCVVVGGGAAGLSAALVLGRARRRTLVVDADEQSNRASTVIGGLLGYDQRPPSELYAAGRRELSSYPSVEFQVGKVTKGTHVELGLELDLDDGRRVHTRRILLATGMQYCPPDLRVSISCGVIRSSSVRSVTAGKCATSGSPQWLPTVKPCMRH
jgi:thioredoxin reductase